jgi:hypothetical protein
VPRQTILHPVSTAASSSEVRPFLGSFHFKHCGSCKHARVSTEKEEVFGRKWEQNISVLNIEVLNAAIPQHLSLPGALVIHHD